MKHIDKILNIIDEVLEDEELCPHGDELLEDCEDPTAGHTYEGTWK